LADAALLSQLLDSLTEPVLVGDTEHTVVYMNRAAAEHYRGGRSLMGTSLLDCHNERSQKIMIEVLAALREGEEPARAGPSEGPLALSEWLRFGLFSVLDASLCVQATGVAEALDGAPQEPCLL
jgi:hypothetical protein